MDLKRDLDEYLLLQSDQKKSFNNFKFTLPTLQRPTLPNWTGRGQAEDESWFRESSSGCCPSLVIIIFVYVREKLDKRSLVC